MINIKLTVAAAVAKILIPLVRILLRYEISHSEFSEIAKRSYVSVANKHFPLPDKKNTYARVAILTGLNLKEVKRISVADENDMLATKGPVNRARQVISGWLRDSDFLDKNKKTKKLPLKGKENGFDELVSRYSGDISARAILDELISVGAVEKTAENEVVLLNEGLIPKKDDAAMMKLIAQHNSDLMNTGLFNLMNEKEPARFQRQVTYPNIPDSALKEFEKYSHEKSMELLKDFDAWLAEHSKKEDTKTDEPTSRVGVGIYYFKNKEND